MTQASFHEDLSRHEEPRPTGSDRAFGVVFGVVSALLGLWPLTRAAGPRPWWLALAALLLAVALLVPRVLHPFNVAWMGLGRRLERVSTPVVMGVIFFGAVLPTAALLRLTGKRPLRLPFDRAAASYWLPRQPPGPPPSSMRQQF
jgi:hypothetical protein